MILLNLVLDIMLASGIMLLAAHIMSGYVNIECSVSYCTFNLNAAWASWQAIIKVTSSLVL